MNRLISALSVALVSLGCFAGAASAKELVLRGEYHLLTYGCKPASTQDNLVVEIFPLDYKCGSSGSAAAPAPMQGYWLEKLKENKCELGRKANLYINGSLYQAKEFGEFQLNGAHFIPDDGDYFPPGSNGEVVAPRVIFHARVFKANGEAQSKAKSYAAKVICEKLTIDLGPLMG